MSWHQNITSYDKNTLYRSACDFLFRWACDHDWSNDDKVRSAITDMSGISKGVLEEPCIELGRRSYMYPQNPDFFCGWDFSCILLLEKNPSENAPNLPETIKRYVDITGDLIKIDEKWKIQNYNVSECVDYYNDESPRPRRIKFMEKRFLFVEELLNYLVYLPDEWIFRGHANEKWALVPSGLRTAGKVKDSDTYYQLRNVNTPLKLRKEEFKKKVMFLDAQKYRNMEDEEWDFLMQHNGIPTLLLDWTLSPLVALYFCVNGRSEDDDKDGCIWVLDHESIEQWRKNTKVHKNDCQPQVILPPAYDLQMRAQYSQFIYFKIGEEYGGTYHSLGNNTLMKTGAVKRKIIIDKYMKETLRRYLHKMHIRREYLFPNLKDIAKTVAE